MDWIKWRSRLLNYYQIIFFLISVFFISLFYEVDGNIKLSISYFARLFILSVSFVRRISPKSHRLHNRNLLHIIIKWTYALFMKLSSRVSELELTLSHIYLCQIYTDINMRVKGPVGMCMFLCTCFLSYKMYIVFIWHLFYFRIWRMLWSRKTGVHRHKWSLIRWTQVANY